MARTAGIDSCSRVSSTVRRRSLSDDTRRREPQRSPGIRSEHMAARHVRDVPFHLHHRPSSRGCSALRSPRTCAEHQRLRPLPTSVVVGVRGLPVAQPAPTPGPARNGAPVGHITRSRIASIMASCLAALAAPAATDAAPSPVSWAPPLHEAIVPLRASSMGRQLATWYGPGLFGGPTACGHVLRPSTWGIAHRTLPCGALVTLVHRGRRVTVRVIDRGPYSGATVDLTERTKSFLRFDEGYVHVTRVRRWRAVPAMRGIVRR